MASRLLDFLIDLCVLLDQRVRWRWVDRLFLWAWHHQQARLGAADAAWDQEMADDIDRLGLAEWMRRLTR